MKRLSSIIEDFSRSQMEFENLIGQDILPSMARDFDEIALHPERHLLVKILILKPILTIFQTDGTVKMWNVICSVIMRKMMMQDTDITILHRKDLQQHLDLSDTLRRSTFCA